MTLAQSRKGETVRIVTMPGGIMRAQILRLGIAEDSHLTCVLNIPAGPVVVRRGALEVALGRKIASLIEVQSSHA